MNKELPHPKSAPVQSPLQKSAKQLRIPATSTEGLKNRYPMPDFTPSKITPNYSQTSLSSISTKRSTSSNDILTSPYSKSPSALHLRKGQITIDTKRLVDQFYNQESSSPSLAPASGKQRSQSNSMLLLSALNTDSPESSSSNNNNGNNTLNNNDNGDPDETQVDIKNFNFLKYSSDNKVQNDNKQDIDIIQQEIRQIQQKVTKEISSQLDFTNTNYTKDSNDFKEILDELNSMKSKFTEYIQLINSNHEIFNDNYDHFKKELVKLYESLEVIKTFEESLKRSRDRLNLNKKKLFELRQKIEITEELQFKRSEMTKIRKKWILIGAFSIMMLYISWRIVN